MEPCLRFGLIVSFLQLQDAATRTPSLPAGWWILNGNREKNKKSYANIILLLWFFFQGNRIAFNTLLLQWSSYQLPGHLTRLVPKALAVAENVDRSFTSATSRMFAATKKWHRTYRATCPTWGPTPRGVQRDPTLGPKPNTGNSKMDRNGAEMTWNCFLCFWFPGSLMLLKKPFQDKSTYKVR